MKPNTVREGNFVLITVDWVGPNPEIIVEKATPKGTELGKTRLYVRQRDTEVNQGEFDVSGDVTFTVCKYFIDEISDWLRKESSQSSNITRTKLSNADICNCLRFSV